MEKEREKNNQMVIYQNPDGSIHIDVRFEDETVWLSQAQMGELFGKSKKNNFRAYTKYF